MNIRSVWIWIFFSVVLVSGLFFIPTRSEYIRLAVASHEYDRAHRLLKPYLSPRQPPLWALSLGAEVEVRRGYPERAAQYLERLLKKTPLDNKMRADLARLYLSMNEPRRALLHFAYLAREQKIDLQTFHEVVRVEDLLNKNRSVIALYHQMLKKAPASPSLWNELVEYDKASGNLLDEKKTLEELLSRNPHREDYLREIIAMDYSLGDYRGVVSKIQQLVALHGNMGGDLEDGIRSFMHLGKGIEAFLLYQKLKNDVSSRDALEGVAWIFYHHHYETLSLSVFDDLVRRYPMDRRYRDDQVWLSEKLGWFSRSRKAILAEGRHGLDRPENVRIRILDLETRFHRQGKAQQDLLTWMGETGASLSVLNLYIDFSKDQNHLPLAISLLRQANSLYPGREDLQMELGTFYAWNNEPGKAGSMFLSESLSHDQGRERLLLAEKNFEDGNRNGSAKGVLFRVVFQDGPQDYLNDLEHLFQLYKESSDRGGLSLLSRAANRFPEHFSSQEVMIAQEEVWAKKIRPAKREIDHLISAFPTNRALLFVASSWFSDLGDPDLSLPYDWKLYRMIPSDPMGVALLIKHLRWSGHERQVPSLSRQLLVLDPQNPLALSYLANDRYSRGHYRESIRYFRKLLALGAIRQKDLYHLARAYDQIGNRKMAVFYYRSALRRLDAL